MKCGHNRAVSHLALKLSGQQWQPEIALFPKMSSVTFHTTTVGGHVAGVVVFDKADARVNTLNEAVLRQLQGVLASISEMLAKVW
jgi:hypothetical protein